jgi:MFS family permease
VACGATTLAQFVIARALQGAGAALMTPVGRALVLRNAEKRDLMNAIALLTWPGLLGPVIAPVLGGFITTYLSWRWNFLLNAPLGTVAVLLAWRRVPRRRLGAPADGPARTAAVFNGVVCIDLQPAVFASRRPVCDGGAAAAGIAAVLACHFRRARHPSRSRHSVHGSSSTDRSAGFLSLRHRGRPFAFAAVAAARLWRIRCRPAASS